MENNKRKTHLYRTKKRRWLPPDFAYSHPS
uniref:Uncharacterized protein n=1 Tax=Triticum urartu TaxID=4572 RepID=A0A8R7QK53_TRIUA